MSAHDVLGPDSVTWDRLGQWRLTLMFHRSLILQAAHPAIGAAVRQFSAYPAHPWRRLFRTLDSLQTYVYGTASERRREITRLERLHRRMRGTDEQGREFTAADREARAWVHLTFVETMLTMCELGGDPLEPAEAARLYDEWRGLGTLFGIADADQPANLAEYREYFDRTVADVLEDNTTVRDLLSGRIFDAPVPGGLPIPDLVWSPLRYAVVATVVQGTIATLPAVYRERLRLTALPGTGLFVSGVHHAARVVTALLPKPWRYLPIASAAIRAADEPAGVDGPRQTPESYFTTILDQTGDGVLRWGDLLGMAREVSTHLDLDESDENDVHDAFESWWRQLRATASEGEDVTFDAYRLALAEGRYPGEPYPDEGYGRVADVVCRLIDRNGNGEVTRAEYARLLDQSVRRYELIAALRALDHDEDGILYTEELRVALHDFLTGRADLAAARYLFGRA